MLKVSSVEKVSCKNITPLFEIFSQRCANILVRFFEVYRPLISRVKLFDSKSNCSNKTEFNIVKNTYFCKNIQYAAFYKIENVMAVCSYYVTYAFQSKSTVYSCLNVKELLA